jgi:mono/diheme cytochrome c family protein
MGTPRASFGHAGVRAFATIACGLTLAAASWASAAQGEAWPIWTGAFSADQAARGKASYDLFCASCHGLDLAGQNGPALKGERFLSIWDGATLREFYRKISTTMPRAQARLDDAVYLDVISYVLQQNGFPTGPRELTGEPDALARFQIVGASGPQAAEIGQLVSAVGCLARDAGGWVLTRASTPVRSRSLEQTSADDLKALESVPAGSATLRLMAVAPGADEHEGHRMEAKGLLSSAGIAAMSLQMVTATCG